MIRPILTATLMIAALPAWAGELSERWTPIGTVEATIDGAPATFVVPYDTEKDRSYGSVRSLAGKRTVNILGVTPKDDGTPGNPQIQFTFWIEGDGVRLLSMEIYDDQGWRKPLSIGPDGGSGGIDTAEVAGLSVTATFSGEMQRIDMTDATEAPVIVADEAAVAISGSFAVALTEK